FGNDLALLLRHQARDVLRALAYESCRLAQHLGAVIGACRAPDRKALVRGLERLVEVACGRMWQMGQNLPGCRVEDILAHAAVAAFPLTIDVKREFGIHQAIPTGARP